MNGKRHIEYTCRKISKRIGIFAKARNVLYKSCLMNLYYTFAYPYFIYCNQEWGNAYETRNADAFIRTIWVTWHQKNWHKNLWCGCVEFISIIYINIYIQRSVSIAMFKYSLRCHLIDQKLHVDLTWCLSLCMVRGFCVFPWLDYDGMTDGNFRGKYNPMSGIYRTRKAISYLLTTVCWIHYDNFI